MRFLFLIIHRNINICYPSETLTVRTPMATSTENLGWKRCSGEKPVNLYNSKHTQACHKGPALGLKLCNVQDRSSQVVCDPTALRASPLTLKHKSHLIQKIITTSHITLTYHRHRMPSGRKAQLCLSSTDFQNIQLRDRRGQQPLSRNVCNARQHLQQVAARGPVCSEQTAMHISVFDELRIHYQVC